MSVANDFHLKYFITINNIIHTLPSESPLMYFILIPPIFIIPFIYYYRNPINQYLTHYLSSKLIEMHHGYYIINYPFGVSWYKIIVPRKRGPTDISRILRSSGGTSKASVDITDTIKPFLGPYNDFHSSKIATPTMLGYPEGIIIEDLFCFDKKEINGNQIINLG